MRSAWRAADIRAAEELLMARLPDGELMRRAAHGLAHRCARTLMEHTHGVYGRRVLLLAGPGNNGADALYAGAILAQRGAAVTAVVLDPNRVHHHAFAAFTTYGGVCSSSIPDAVDVVVDGILGIGGRGGLRGNAATLADAVAHRRASPGRRPLVVAVDVPSGIDVDTGAVTGKAVKADITVTFGVMKPGLLIGEGSLHCGQIDLVDIGLDPWLKVAPAVSIPDQADIAAWWPTPHPRDDKYSRGVVGIATGSSTYPGAAILSVGGALAGPCGMVRYAGAAAELIQAKHPSVIVTNQVKETGTVQSWVCGSGLGTDERAITELRAVLASPVPICLDADAITLLADDSTMGLLRKRTAPTVLTPHDREFSRLAGQPPGNDRVEATVRLAAKTRAVVLLKGYRTIVATPDGHQVFVNPTGAPALASAGTGDVLAGLLGSLLAAGLSPDKAAIAAAYAHGLAGRLAATSGPTSAENVVESLRIAVTRVTSH